MSRTTFFAIVQFAFALAAAISIAFVPLGSSPWLIWACLAVFYWCVVRATLSPVRLMPTRPSHVTGELLFLVFAYLLLFFPYQLAVLGATDLWFSRFVEFTFVEHTNPSLMASTSGALAFSAGVRLLPGARRVPMAANVETRPRADGYLGLVVLLQAVAAGTFVLSGGLAQMWGGSYIGSTTADRTQDGLYFLITLFAMNGIAGALYRRWRFQRFGTPAIACLAAASAWATILLVLGDRNNFLLLALPALVSCSLFFLRIGPATMVVFLSGALLGYNVIEEARQSTTRDFASLLTAVHSGERRDFAESSFTNTTVTSRAALALVPGSYPYFKGKLKVIGFAGVVPYSRGLFVSPNDPFVTSADVITAGVLGSGATWSLGTNVISDIYVDFGAVGIPVLMFCAGMFLSFLTKRFIATPSLMWTVAYIISVALFAELPRYSLDFPVRPLAWTFLLMALYRLAYRVAAAQRRVGEGRGTS